MAQSDTASAWAFTEWQGSTVWVMHRYTVGSAAAMGRMVVGWAGWPVAKVTL